MKRAKDLDEAINNVKVLLQGECYCYDRCECDYCKAILDLEERLADEREKR